MKIMCLCLCFFLVMNVAYASEKVVAVVNEEVITSKELKDFLDLLKVRLSLEYNDEADLLRAYNRQKQEALENLIEDRLIIQEAKAEKIEIPQERIDQKLEEFTSRFMSQQHFEETLRNQGLSFDSLRQKITEQLLIRGIIDEKVKARIEISPSDITNYYRTHREEFTLPDCIDYRFLKFVQKTRAYQVYEELTKAEDVGQALDEYSQILIKGTLTKGETRPEVEHLFNLEEGQFSAPLEIDDEYYIFIVDRKKPQSFCSIAEVQDKVWNIVYQDKYIEKLSLWIESLKEKAVIKKLNHSQ